MTYNEIDEKLVTVELICKGCTSKRKINGNFTLNKTELKFYKVVKEMDGKKKADRGTTLDNLPKKLKEICPNPQSKISFTLLNESQGIINDLENSDVNMENIGGQSCCISGYLQGLFHIVLPQAMRKLNEKRAKKIENLDDLKNNESNKNDFYNAVIDTAKKVISIQTFGHEGQDKDGKKNVRPDEVYKFEKKNLEDDKYKHQSLFCTKLINEAIYKFAMEAKKEDEESNQIMDDIFNKVDLKTPPNPPKKKTNNSIGNQEFIKIFEIQKSTIISEVMKIKIDNKFYLNIVLNFDENTLDDNNLNIIKLLDNCRQLKKDNYTKKKIQQTSEIIYMIVDRISNGEEKKNFILYEDLYLDKNIGFFTKDSSSNSILYELKFIIYHKILSETSGHFTAFSKYRGKWHYFNDLDSGYAKIRNPPLTDFVEDVYPVCFFYVKSEEKSKDSENCIII